MFYSTDKNNHGLDFNPFKACIIPRPIAWITTINENGLVNLAPYSYFNAVADMPPMIMFAITDKHQQGDDKDTLRNVENTKELVVNIACWKLREQVNTTSGAYDHDFSEIDIANLATLPSVLVKPPRIKDSPIQLECIFLQSVQLPLLNDQHINRTVFAKVVGIHIADEIIVDGKIDVLKFNPIARLGYMEYCTVNNKFVMQRPVVKNNIIVEP